MLPWSPRWTHLSQAPTALAGAPGPDFWRQWPTAGAVWLWGSQPVLWLTTSGYLSTSKCSEKTAHSLHPSPIVACDTDPITYSHTIPKGSGCWTWTWVSDLLFTFTIANINQSLATDEPSGKFPASAQDTKGCLWEFSKPNRTFVLCRLPAIRPQGLLSWEAKASKIPPVPDPYFLTGKSPPCMLRALNSHCNLDTSAHEKPQHTNRCIFSAPD